MGSGSCDGVVLVVDKDLHVQPLDQQVQYRLEGSILDSRYITRLVLISQAGTVNQIT